MAGGIARRWKLLSGSSNWGNLLNPLDSDLRQYLAHYGAIAQSTYDTFNNEKLSKYTGSSRYSKKNLFSKVGLVNGNPYKYKVVKYIYATSKIEVPFMLKSFSHDSWLKGSNWIGYVAVATDEGKKALGRRDILVAWRGTVRPSEWLKNLDLPLVSASEIVGKGGENAKVHRGFLSIYTSFDPKSRFNKTSARDQDLSSPTSLNHIVFAISSSEKSWSTTKNYVKLWWRSKEMNGCVFLEKKPRDSRFDQTDENSLPRICISGDASPFRYTYRNGPRWAIRVARAVSEIVAQNHSNVRWFVFGDDYTVFFPDNLVKTLSKYDHGLWYYVGTNSESYAQNKMFSYNMAFAGAGFAISYSLAKVLGKVLDSCLHRYPHLYGSDSRIHACIQELGVSLTHEPGFHQMDIRGSMYGILASHPLSPLLSLHLSDSTDPIFPNMTTLESIKHLSQSVTSDPHRVMQQTVCYDKWFSWTISVSWGYAVHIFPHHVFLPDALRTLETYTPLKNKGGVNEFYNVDSMVYDRDHPCQTPPAFFLHELSSEKDMVRTSYRMTGDENCSFDMTSPRRIREIVVFSHKLELDTRKLVAPRRHCCDVLRSSTGNKMEIDIREYDAEELIHMPS